MLYVEEESTKLSMYTLLFLDFHMSAPCNARLLTSSLDLDWELPFSIALWDAGTAESWSERLSQEPRVQALLGADEAAEPPCPNTRSLALATQSLMSGSPSPQLMVALAVSPMATLFVLTNIDAFVRDFTRCYYQMPPALSDPSAFHIFTQSQNRQVIAALRHIARVVPSGGSPGDGEEAGPSGPYRPMWRAIECAGLAVKIALYKPDDLLIGGIVDSSAVAGLATATHLTLGRYAGTRRSLEALLQHNTGDDAVIMILDEAMALLSSILSSSQQDALREPPWAAMASYRTVLAIWRSLRWAASEMRARSAAAAAGPQGQHQQVRRRFEAPAVIFHAIMDVAMEETAALPPGQEGPSDALMAASPELGEACYARAVLGFWRKRDAWPIGRSMATVLEEIVADEYPGLVDGAGAAAWWGAPEPGLG